MGKGIFVLNQDLSGINAFLFAALRRQGWDVRSVDVHPVSRIERLILAAWSFHPSGPSWRRRFHRALGAWARSRWGLRRRTDLCSRLLAEHARPDDILLTFTLFAPSRLRWTNPYVIFKDYTVALAMRTYPQALDVHGAAQERRLELEATFCRGAAVVLTASENTRRSVIDDYAVSHERVIAVGEGVCFDELPPAPSARTDETDAIRTPFRRQGLPAEGWGHRSPGVRPYP